MAGTGLTQALRTTLLSAAALAPLSVALAAPAAAADTNLIAAPLLSAPSLALATQVVAPQTPPATPGNDANDPVGLEETEEDEDETDDDERNIVVTGTLIRGSAPTGTNPITVGEEQIEAVAASRSSEVLASLPQIGGGFFNGIPQVEAVNATAARGFNQTTSRPQLRPSPFGPTDSGNSTLILFDGARQAGIGVNGSAANPDSVPPPLLARVEVNPDGGSATYGSDAIGGVINFITIRRYDGIQVSGAVGMADDYTTWEANGVAGTDWGTGGAYIGYAFSKNDILLNRERDYFNPLDFATGLERGTSCPISNIQLAAGGGLPQRFYSVPQTGAPNVPFFTVVAGGVSGTPNVCTPSADATLASANEQHAVLARIEQNLTDNIVVSLKARFSDQQQWGLTSPTSFNMVINNTNPFFRPIPAGANVPAADSARTSYNVLGNFEAAFGPDERIFANSSQGWGALADLTWNIGEWRLYAFANYDHTESDFIVPSINSTVLTQGTNALNAGTTSTTTCSLQPSTANCFNPFNIAASNPTLLQNLANFFNGGAGEDTIKNVRAVVDGPLFEMPGGPLRIAVGAEYFHDEFTKGLFFDVTPTPQLTSIVQTNSSLFGEINAPVIGDANDVPLFHSLTLSAAGRYDKFSDQDGVFNPKFGVAWQPIEQLTFRGNWSRTYRAPTTADLINARKENTTIGAFPATVSNCFACDRTKPLPLSTDVFLALGGTQPDVTPQKGENWSFGVDFAWEQFRASVTYYRINYLNILANPSTGLPIFPLFGHLVTLCPGTPGNYNCSPEQIQEHINKAGNTAPVQAAIQNRSNIYSLFDTRTDNLGNAKVGGVDYSFQFTQPTDWGSVFLALQGAIITMNQSQAVAGAPFVDNLDTSLPTAGNFRFGRSLHRATIRAGLNYENFRAQATVNHTAGYDVNRSAILFQDRVEAYNVMNLFFSYEFEDASPILNGLELNLNINNVFDNDPPFYSLSNDSNGYINGTTLGRLVKIGFRKKFGAGR